MCCVCLVHLCILTVVYLCLPLAKCVRELSCGDGLLREDRQGD